MHVYLATDLSDFNTMDAQCLSWCVSGNLIRSGAFETFSTDRYHDSVTGKYAIVIEDPYKTYILSQMNTEEQAKCTDISYSTHPEMFPLEIIEGDEDLAKTGFVGNCTSVTGATYTGSFNGTSNSTHFPFSYYWKYSVSAQIITAAELNNTAIQITGIQNQFSYSDRDGHFDNNHFVYMMHTTESDLSNATDVQLSGIAVTDKTLVWSGNFYSPPRTTSQMWSGDIYSFEGPNVFDNNFCYDGTSNVIILWEKKWGSFTTGGPTFETASSSKTNGSIYDYDDYSYSNLAPSLGSRRWSLKFNH